MDSAVDDRQVIVIRRRTGGDVAMIAAGESGGPIEMAHLPGSAQNTERLLGVCWHGHDVVARCPLHRITQEHRRVYPVEVDRWNFCRGAIAIDVALARAMD